MEQISIFRFGEFTLDGVQRRLLRAGQDVYLPPKTFELLLYLLRNRGRVITKDELLEAVWPDVNVVENTLAQRIREIRERWGRRSRRAIHQDRSTSWLPVHRSRSTTNRRPRRLHPPISAALRRRRSPGSLSRPVLRRRSSDARRLLHYNEPAPDLADSTLRPPVDIGLRGISEVSKPLTRRQHHRFRR